MSDAKRGRDVSATLTSMLSKIPGVIATTKKNSASFKTGKKVFAFTKGDGIVLKLPPETVTRLVSKQKAVRLVMGKRTMKEWVVISCRSLQDCEKYVAFFKEAISYVSEG